MIYNKMIKKMEKQQKKTRLERHSKEIKVFMILCMAIFLINFISAIELNPFASIKIAEKTLTLDTSEYLKSDFNSQYGIIRLSKTFFWFETDKIAEYSLTKNTETCLINCEAEGKITLYQDGILFDDVKFKSLTGKDTLIKSSEYLIFEGYKDNFVDVPIYTEICLDLINNSKSCSQVISGYSKENQQIEIWNKYNGEVLKAGNYRWKIKGVKESSQSVDFIPIINNKEFSEWAVWNSTLKDKFTHCYNFNNETGTNLEDKIGSTNGTWVGDPDYVASLNGNGASFHGNSYITFGTGTGFPTGTNDFTIIITLNQTFPTGATQYGITGSSLSVGLANQMTFSNDPNTNREAFFYQDGNYGTIWTNLGNYLTTMGYTTYILNGTTSGVSFYTNGHYLGFMDRHGVTTTNWFLGGATGNNLSGVVDSFAIADESLTWEEMVDINNSIATETFCGDSIAVDTSPLVTLNSPIDYYNSSIGTINFNCSGGDNRKIENISLWINGQRNYTITNGVTNFSELYLSRSLAEGVYNWTCSVDDNATLTQTGWATNRTLNIDTTAPVLIPATNLTNLITFILPINSTWSFNATDPHLQNCYYNTTDHPLTIVTCNSTIETEWATQGSKIIRQCANDTLGFETCQSNNIVVTYITINQYDDKDHVGVGTEVTFNLTISSVSIPSTNAYLVLNNTHYPATIINAGTNAYYFERSVIIPDGWGSATGNILNWSWGYNITGITTNQNTSITNLTVYSMSVDDCSTYGHQILNLSLKDEELNSFVDIASPNITTIETDLYITSLSNSSQYWQFYKKWNNNNSVAVCVPNNLLNYSSYKIEFTIGYDSTDHVREFYYLENGILDNTDYFNSYTNNHIDLMDLLTADSTTFLFSYTDSAKQEVDDIIVHTFRKYIGEGLFREVERSKQDNNGQTHVHLVEEDVIYYFMITQYGNILYTSDTYNAKCLSTPCSIELSSSQTSFNWSIIDNEGGKYSTSADKTTRIATTTFNLDTISLVNVSLYKYNGTQTLINSSSLTAMSGSIGLTVPLAYGNQTFFVVIYKDGEYIKSAWVDLTNRGQDYFGTTGAILGGLIVLTLLLMAVSEGVGAVIFTFLALIVILIMKLIDLNWFALISIICAGGIIIFKLTRRQGIKG